MKADLLDHRIKRLERIYKVCKSDYTTEFESNRIELDEMSLSDEDISSAIKDQDIINDIEFISKKLKTADLAGYVSSVNDLMNDYKGRRALELFAGALSKEQLEKAGLVNVSFKLVSNKAIPVKYLYPTQSEISFSKSLDSLFTKYSSCIPELIKGQSVKLCTPIITCNGCLIIDGHHRWAQVACVNPNATMETLDLQIKTDTMGIDFTDIEDVLKVTQSLILAITLKSGKKQLPSEDVGLFDNLYTLSAQQLFDKIINISDDSAGLDTLAKTDQISFGTFNNFTMSSISSVINLVNDYRLNKIKKNVSAWIGLDNNVKAAIYLVSNCLSLHKPDVKATLRQYMPQTNGWNDITISQLEIDKAAKNGINIKEIKSAGHMISKLEKLDRYLSRVEYFFITV